MQVKFLELLKGEEGFAAYILSAFLAVGAVEFFRSSQTMAAKSYSLIQERIDWQNEGRSWTGFNTVLDDDELCGNTNILSGLQKYKIAQIFDPATGTKGGKKAFGATEIAVTIEGSDIDVIGSAGEIAAVGLDPHSIMQSGSPLSRTFVNTPIRVPFRVINYWMARDEKGNLIKLNNSDFSNGKNDEASLEKNAKKNKEVLTDWVEYMDYKGGHRLIYAWTEAEFLVELDSAGKPAACYSQISSRNFCVASGGIFHSDAPAGTPKCRRT